MQTEVPTVGDVLAEAGIILGENDSVMPGPETPLADEMLLQISRAIPLSIHVDGQTYAIFSSAQTTAEVLANAGIILGELDMVTPGLDSPPNAGDTIHVVRVREESIVFDQEVPYQTIYQPSDELDLDTKSVLSSGLPGIKRQSTRIRYEDGVEVSRISEGEWMEQEPVNEVIGYGTRIITNVIDTPEGPREYWRVVRMRVTAYTAASSGKPPDHPAYGITASGRPAGTGIVAVDPNVIPFRSEVFVPGYGVGFAGDTGGGVKGRWIDLGYDEDELQTWNGYTDVYYLTPIPAEINYLLPEVLP
jgi:3D (Asp-Asp-Asp) domain-containing protein